MNADTILAERLRRQALTEPITSPSRYDDLFRSLQPVCPIAMTYPGNPPQLVHRVAFDDATEADKRRADRRLYKGRFVKGKVSYVHADDLETYATVFHRPLDPLNDTQQRVYDALNALAPLTPRQMKEETGILNKEIAPALNRMQEAFLVYEDQPDNDWERGWYLFETEWREVDLERRSWEDAASDVFERFFHSHVFATFQQAKDWSSLSAKQVKGVVAAMEKAVGRSRLRPVRVEGLGDGWMLERDMALPNAVAPPSVFMLHKSDPLVHSHLTELKERFGELETLQYLLIDGRFTGAVVGHWRIGPHDVDDIALHLPKKEIDARRGEIVAEVAKMYAPPRHHILNVEGQPLSLLR